MVVSYVLSRSLSRSLTSIKLLTEVLFPLPSLQFY